MSVYRKFCRTFCFCLSQISEIEKIYTEQEGRNGSAYRPSIKKVSGFLFSMDNFL